MNIGVLFDGAGLARLGLERAGHKCTGIELDPVKHYLSTFVGSGRCILADVRHIDLDKFDALWCSPPCQLRSAARTQGPPVSSYAEDLLQWSLNLPHEVLWVENILSQKSGENDWGRKWNAAQFTSTPIQSRNRVIGGRYRDPVAFRPYKKRFIDVCPAITATEWKGHRVDDRRASRFYGRKLTIEECAYHQGFQIPEGWRKPMSNFTEASWKNQLYEAIGNGVPVFMAEAFGRVYP